MDKQNKKIYGVFLMSIVGLWISSVVLLAMSIGGNVCKIFVILLGYMFISCLIEYKKVIKRKVENFSVCLSAVSLVTCAFYLLYLGFMLGRVVVRFLF